LLARTEGIPDQVQVVQQVPVADHHAARLAGGPGGVLQQRQRLRRYLRGTPTSGRVAADLLHRQGVGRLVSDERMQDISQRRRRQEDPRAGVLQQEAQAGQGALGTHWMRGQRGDRDRPGVLAAEEGRDEIQARGEHEQDAVAGGDGSMQGVTDGRGPAVQAFIGEHRGITRPVGEEAVQDSRAVLGGPRRQKFDEGSVRRTVVERGHALHPYWVCR
jgi:hypothetical protein